jgi:O-antigen/teichoic acid export membrane protein
MISRRFIKSSFLYTVAGALPMASAVILLPFYQYFISVADFGALSIFIAFSAFIQILVTFSFDASVYLHYHDYKDDPKKLSEFISSVFIFILITGVGVGLVFTAIGSFIFELIFTDKPVSFFPYGVISIGTGIFISLFKVYGSFLQTRQRPDYFFWFNLTTFGLIAGLTVAGLYLFPQSLIGPVAGRSIAFLVAAIWAFSMITREFGMRFNYKLLQSLFGFNRPSLLYQLQQWSINYLDRFLMVFFFPLSQIGVYDFAVKCMMAIDFIVGGLYNSFFPKVIGIVATQEEKGTTPEINRYYHGFIAVIMILVCGSVTFSIFIIDMGWIQKGFQASLYFFPVIGIVYLIRGMRYYFIFPYAALKYNKPLPLIYLVITTLKVILFLIFVGPFDLYGVILSSMVSSIAELALLRVVIRNKFKFTFNPNKIILAPFFLALIMASSLIFYFKGLQYWLYIIYPIVCVSILGWVYRNEIKVLKLSTLLRK